MTIMNVIRQLENTSKLTEKRKILSSNADMEGLQECLVLALDPSFLFYCKKVPKVHCEEGTFDLEQIVDCLMSLNAREVTGNAALERVKQTLIDQDNDGRELLTRILKKDLQCGVSRKIVNSVFDDLISEYPITLASQYDEKYIEFPVYAEPKIDGWRVNVIIKDGSVTYLSRSGKPMETLESLTESILSLYPEDCMVDGEIKSGHFQDSSSVFSSKKNKKTANIILYAFDYLHYHEWENKECSRTFQERRKHLKHNGTSVQILPLEELHNLSEVHSTYKKHLTQYEGTILKKKNGSYEFKRTRDWMKVKPIQTIDVEITGYIEGTKKYTGMLGAFTFNYNDQPCRVGGGFSDKEREEFWKRKDKMIGTIIEVEFMESTESGKTRHVRFIRERNFKGEKV